MSSVFKALSDPTRREVLKLLRKGPLTAGELASNFEVSKPTMSVHFRVLKDAGLVRAERNGKSIEYSLRMSVLEEALMGFAQAFGMNPVAGADTGDRTGPLDTRNSPDPTHEEKP
ncbi:autorepressor SdpR family transcription factor [Halomonas denitrificans]|nr:autorepressor SdpR family transcription factor [Halomonas denitrificans]